MATVVPNRLSEALQHSADNIMRLMMEQRRMDQEDEQFAATMRQRRTEADRAHEINEEASAMRSAAFIAGLAQPGQTIGDVPTLLPLLTRAMPDMPPEVMQSLAGQVLSPETVASVINPSAIEHTKGLILEGGPEFDALLDRVVNREVLGSPASAEELAAGRMTAGLRLQGIEALLNSTPEDRRDLLRSAAGLEPETRFRGPDGREYVNTTSTGASLTASFMRANYEAVLGSRAAFDAATQDMAEGLMKQMDEGFNITLGRAAADSIINAWQAEQELAREGELTEENSPMQKLWNSWQTAGRDNELFAMSAFMGAEVQADGMLDRIMNSTPAGQQVMMGLQMAERLAPFPQDQRSELLENITGVVEGLPAFRRRSLGRFGRENTFTFRNQTPPPETPADSSGVTPEMLRTTIDEAVRRGTPRETAISNARAAVGDELVDAALGASGTSPTTATPTARQPAPPTPPETPGRRAPQRDVVRDTVEGLTSEELLAAAQAMPRQSRPGRTGSHAIILDRMRNIAADLAAARSNLDQVSTLPETENDRGNRATRLRVAERRVNELQRSLLSEERKLRQALIAARRSE